MQRPQLKTEGWEGKGGERRRERGKKEGRRKEDERKKEDEIRNKELMRQEGSSDRTSGLSEGLNGVTRRVAQLVRWGKYG